MEEVGELREDRGKREGRREKEEEKMRHYYAFISIWHCVR